MWFGSQMIHSVQLVNKTQQILIIFCTNKHICIYAWKTLIKIIKATTPGKSRTWTMSWWHLITTWVFTWTLNWTIQTTLLHFREGPNHTLLTEETEVFCSKKEDTVRDWINYWCFSLFVNFSVIGLTKNYLISCYPHIPLLLPTGIQDYCSNRVTEEQSTTWAHSNKSHNAPEHWDRS